MALVKVSLPVATSIGDRAFEVHLLIVNNQSNYNDIYFMSHKYKSVINMSIVEVQQSFVFVS